MATYAAYADLIAYLQDSDISAPAAPETERLLQRCEIEVDTLLAGFGAPNESTGLKYNPSTDLQPWQAAALKRAVCAQAQYHLIMGEEFFTQGQYDQWAGPDFSASGKMPYFGPKVSMELAGTGIARVPGVTSVSTSFLGSQSNRYGLSHIRAN